MEWRLCVCSLPRPHHTAKPQEGIVPALGGQPKTRQDSEKQQMKRVLLGVKLVGVTPDSGLMHVVVLGTVMEVPAPRWPVLPGEGRFLQSS